MHLGRHTLSSFLADPLCGADHQPRLAALLHDVAGAVVAIAQMTTRGALGGYLGAHGALNAHGEPQQRLDVLAQRGPGRALPAQRRRRGAGVGGTRRPAADARTRAAHPTCCCSIRSTARRTSTSTCRSARSSRCSSARRRAACRCGRLPAAGPPAGGRRLLHLRTVDDAGAHRGPRHARLHARRRARRVHAHAPATCAFRRRRTSSRSTPATQRFWEAPVQRYVGECQAGTGRRRAGATSTCAGSRRWSPRRIAS